MNSTAGAAGVAHAQDAQPQTEDLGNTQELNSPENIAKLAYALWQYRGYPEGSSEQDWLDSQRQLSRPEPAGAMTGR